MMSAQGGWEFPNITLRTTARNLFLALLQQQSVAGGSDVDRSFIHVFPCGVVQEDWATTVRELATTVRVSSTTDIVMDSCTVRVLPCTDWRLSCLSRRCPIQRFICDRFVRIVVLFIGGGFRRFWE